MGEWVPHLVISPRKNTDRLILTLVFGVLQQIFTYGFYEEDCFLPDFFRLGRRGRLQNLIVEHLAHFKGLVKISGEFLLKAAFDHKLGIKETDHSGVF